MKKKKYFCIMNDGSIVAGNKLPKCLLFRCNIAINAKDGKVLKNRFGCIEIKDMDAMSPYPRLMTDIGG